MTVLQFAPKSGGGGGFIPLVASYMRHLQAERKSQKTLAVYQRGLDMFREHCEQRGLTTEPREVERADIEGWLGSLHGVYAPKTINLRWCALKAFFTWLVEEEEVAIERNPMRFVKVPPLPDSLAPQSLTPGQVTRLLKSCDERGLTGRDRWMARRDAAILQLLVDTGLRAGELIALDLGDVDWPDGDSGSILHVRHGKGDKPRHVPFGYVTARALDRWLRVRDERLQPGELALFLSQQSRRRVTYARLVDIVRDRAESVGLVGLHPHIMRHTFADLWLSDGGSESDLMRIGGWSSKEVRKYGRSGQDRRAREAHKLHSPGDRFGSA